MAANNLVAYPGQEIRSQEEIKFQELKVLIVDTMIERKNVSEEDICQALQDIIDAFVNRRYPEIDHAPWAYACAHVHRFGAQGMGLTRFKVLEALRNCRELRDKFSKPNVNVVSLGGGPGTDVVGLTSALKECGIQTNLSITIVDKVDTWNPFVELIRSSVLEGNYGNASEYFHENQVDVPFITAQLPLHGNEVRAAEALRNADVILMIRFISSIQQEDWKAVIKDVWMKMQPGAIALFIGTPFYENYWTRFEILYLHMCQEEEKYDFNVPNPDLRFGHGVVNPSASHLAVLSRRGSRGGELGERSPPKSSKINYDIGNLVKLS